MDGSRFDCLTRQWTTRRTAIGGLIVGLLGLTGLDAEAKRNGKGNRKRKRKRPGDQAAAEQTKRHEAVRAEKKKRKKKCKGGTVKCGKVCVTASTDAQHCGGCGNPCGSGQACVSGVCATTGPGPDACPSGQIRCGELCVDPTSDESHCGGCGQTCQGDLTCLSGTCGCADASDARCGNDCAATQSDDDHCGQCGRACPGSQNCVGGQCQPGGGCSGELMACGGECVNTRNDDRHCGACDSPCTGGDCVGGECIKCVTQADCGGFSSFNDLVCSNGRCVCSATDKGICQRHSDRSGTCHVCCPGGSGQCPGTRNETCFYNQLPSGQRYGLCDCPTGWDRCESSNNICVEDTAFDSRNCGRFCTDCQAAQDVNPRAICCNGICAGGCSPGASGTGCAPNSPCGPNCNPCADGFICCNMGPGTPPRCILNKTGFCYREE